MKKIIRLIIIAIAFCATTSAQSPLNFTFRSNLAYPGKSLSNLWGYVDTLGNEYALVGTSASVSIVNVSNPNTPAEVFAVAGINSSWREIRTWGKYAYVTTEGCCNGLQIINLSNLPASVTSKYYTGDGAINGQLTKAHSLHIDNGFCYLYGSNLFSGSAVILNLSDPWNPVYTGNSYQGGLSSNYIHDGCVFNDTLWGCHIYGGYFSVMNIANKTTPVLLQVQTTPNTFPHNNWLSDNHRVLFTTDETSNSYLAAYDVADVNNIKLLDKIQSTPGNGSIIHNTYVQNNFAIASYYTEGIIVVDAARPDNLIKTGHYDTSPAFSGNGYHGCWGVYPYLPSGNVIASDIENGLYVLTPNYVRGCYLEGVVTDTITGLPITGATMQVVATAMLEQTAIDGSFKTGTVSPGAYTVTVSKPGYLSKTISNVVLTNGVLTTLNVQLSAPDVNIAGTVLKSGFNTPIANANLTFENAANSYQTVTDLNGNFIINALHPGTYQLTYGKWGYITQCQTIFIDSLTGLIKLNLTTGLYDDFNFNFGWAVVSTASKGKWTRAIPIGTTYATANDANPGKDVLSDCGNWCFVTGNGGGNYNFDDVDSGYTKLTSPVLKLSTYSDPVINYSRWFFASPGSKDTLLVKLNKGTSVVTLEKISANSAGNSTWLNKSFRVLDYFTPGNNFKLSFYIKDAKPDNTVEAGVDLFSVTENNAFAISTNKPATIAGNQNFIASVYPNPFSNQLNIAFAELTNNLKVELVDVMGRIVFAQKNLSPIEELQLDLSQHELQNGIYFLKLTSDDKTALVKVLKN